MAQRLLFARFLRVTRLAIPSGGRDRPSLARVRMLALLTVRNHVHHLPGFIANVAPQVDGIVALDDGSSDGSAEFLASRAEVIELLRIPVDRPDWDEMGNHAALVRAALRLGGEWLLSVDADERLEAQFRSRAERVIRRGRLLGLSAYAVHLRELWDAPDQYRVDGTWGLKYHARLWRARADHQFDTRQLHGLKAPLQARVAGQYPLADLNIYHLGMLRHEDRVARRRRYELADPTARWQPGLGYAYLTDERGLRLERIPPKREYRE